MKSADIALYLQNNPQFFEDHADMLAEVTIPHPYSGRTISLNERQLLTLREQNKNLEKDERLRNSMACVAHQFHHRSDIY